MITLRGSKVKSSPVAGFLPRRDAFFLTVNFPNPLMRTSSPFDREVLRIERQQSDEDLDGVQKKALSTEKIEVNPEKPILSEVR